MKTSKTLDQWLRDCGMHDVELVMVTIGDETWEGARYKRTDNYTANMMAVTHGDKKVTDTYTTEYICCLGDLPKSYLKKGKPLPDAKTCFPKDGVDWYVACYITKEKIVGFESSHPFGHNFILTPWHHKDSIDQYEPKAYTRIPLKVV